MKNNMLFIVTVTITLLYSCFLFAEDKAVRIAAGTNNIPASFTANNAGSEVITCPTSGKAAVWNATGSWLSVGIGSATVAASDVVIILADGTGFNFKLSSPNTTIYFKGTDGAISANYATGACGGWF